MSALVEMERPGRMRMTASYSSRSERIVSSMGTTSPTVMPSAWRTTSFTGTKYPPFLGNRDVSTVVSPIRTRTGSRPRQYARPAWRRPGSRRRRRRAPGRSGRATVHARTRSRRRTRTAFNSPGNPRPDHPRSRRGRVRAAGASDRPRTTRRRAGSRPAPAPATRVVAATSHEQRDDRGAGHDAPERSVDRGQPVEVRQRPRGQDQGEKSDRNGPREQPGRV